MFNGAPHVDPGSEIWDFLSGEREDDKAIKYYLGISIMPGTTVCRLVPHKAPPPHTPYPRILTIETKIKSALVSVHHPLICAALINV